MGINDNFDGGADLSKMFPKNTDGNDPGNNSPNGSTSKMIRVVFRLSGGTIRTERQAKIILTAFTAIAAIVSLILIINSMRVPSPPPKDQMVDLPTPVETPNIK